MPVLPDPTARHPLVMPDGRENAGLVHLQAVIDHPNWEVGRRSYANDFDPPDDWAARLAPYLHPGAPERLRIGPFCQIAHGVRFITASANHAMEGISTYPFTIFDPEALAEVLPAPPGFPTQRSDRTAGSGTGPSSFPARGWGLG